MKITKLKTYHVKPRWLFLEVETDAGITGLGEPVVEGRAQTVETAIRELERYLIGKDPRDIEKHWNTIYRGTFYRNGPILTSALSGIEQALWDILGKSLNVPVWRLLGGKVRDRIRMYGWVAGEQTGSYIENFKQSLKENKFTAYKLCPIPPMQYIETPDVIDKIVENVKNIRKEVGRSVDIALDFHGRTTPAVARKLARRLEEVDPMFIEEPVLPGDWEGMRDVAMSTIIPVAAGERLFTRWQFRDVIEKQAVAIIQPDLSHCGGIMEAKKIAAMAEARNIAVAPHCPLGPIALASCLQFDACTPNFLCQEHLTLGEGILKTPFVVKDGFIDVPEGPGLGIELDHEALKSRLFEGDWETPTLTGEWPTLPDGSFAEW